MPGLFVPKPSPGGLGLRQSPSWPAPVVHGRPPTCPDVHHDPYSPRSMIPYQACFRVAWPTRPRVKYSSHCSRVTVCDSQGWPV